jgi:glycosyltransferase involved in cell wall biosynthesis
MPSETDTGTSAQSAAPTLLLSVIVPARNEAEPIRACLASLVQQSEPDFSLGSHWELIAVDDASTDGTQQIASESPGVTIIDAPPLPESWTGKTNAAWFGAQRAKGKWLLFTDADTVHEPGDLRRAMHEAERHRVAMLSYSPCQSVRGIWQRMVMPLIFAELAQKYQPRLVNSPDSPIAAANGQFLLIDRAAYLRIGGHAAVRASMVEDVELARRCKQAHEGLRFRYAPDAVSARMYRSFTAMCEGWRKNLVLLFPDALTRAVWKLFQAALIFGLPFLAVWLYLTVARVEIIWAVVLWWAWRLGLHYSRVSKAHFSATDTLLSPFGLPLFSWLLLDSWMQTHLHRATKWKGRTYPTH